MNKLRLLFSLILLSAFGSLYAQIDEGTFMKDVGDFVQNTNEGNWDAVLDMTYPGLFELIPREDMKSVFESMLAESGMKMESKILSVEEIFDPYTFEGSTYQRVDYQSALQFTLSDELWAQRELMIEGMKKSGDFSTLETDDAMQSIIVQQLSTMIAIQTPKYTGWKYLQFQKNQAMMLEQLVPKDILSKMFAIKN